MSTEKKSKEVRVNKVILTIGEKEISLTIDEIKKLQDALAELTGKKIIKEVVVEEKHHYYPIYRYDWYMHTNWLATNRTDQNEYSSSNQITYDSKSKALCLSVNS